MPRPCPKCQALNADDAEFCSLCFHGFVQKAPVRAGPAPAFFPDVEVLVEGWVLEGCLLAREDGLYFFVRESAYEGRLLGRVVHEALDAGAGLVAKTLIRLATLGRESRRPKPAWLGVRPREEALSAYDEVLVEAPGIVACRQFFLIAKAGLCFHGDEVLEAQATGGRFDVRGLGEPEVASRLLSVAGHPCARQPLSGTKRLAYGLAALITLTSLAGLAGDVYEADKAWRWLSSKQGVQGVVFDGSPEGASYLVNGRQVSSRELRKLPWWERMPLFKLAGVMTLVVVCSLLLAARQSLRP